MCDGFLISRWLFMRLVADSSVGVAAQMGENNLPPYGFLFEPNVN